MSKTPIEIMFKHEGKTVNVIGKNRVKTYKELFLICFFISFALSPRDPILLAILKKNVADFTEVFMEPNKKLFSKFEKEAGPLPSLILEDQFILF